MTVHKLKVSISVEQGGGRPIINIEDNSVCNVTRLETLLSFHPLDIKPCHGEGEKTI